MTRDEYLQILRDNLTTMTDDEKDDVIRYYLEYFIDSGDEQAAMEELGAPQKLAKRLCGTNATEDNNENFSTENFGSTQDKGNNSQSGANENYNYSDSTMGGNYTYYGGEENTKKKKSVGKIVALACTAPLWVPLAFAGLIIALSLVIVAAALVFAVYVVFAACVAAGVASVVAGVIAFTKSLADGLVVIGGGLFMFGVGILAFFLGNHIVKGMRYIFKRLLKRN